MKVSRKGLIEIASHEGIVPYPYLDSVGVWTFGIGHTKYAGHPDPERLTKGQEYPIDFVMDLFREDIKKFERRVDKAVQVELQQHEFDALVSFDYNTGGIYRAKLTKLLNSGARNSEVARAFLGWLRPPEIAGRRRKEMRLFLSGTYSANGRATKYKADAMGRVKWSTAKQINLEELWTDLN